MLNDPLAAQMALLVMRAEDMFAALQASGQQDRLDPPLDPAVAAAYDLKGYIAGNDALLVLNPATNKQRLQPSDAVVFYGFVACSKASPDQYVVVIRGTGDLWEWFKNGEFAPVAHPPSGGQVEAGFDSIYQTMTYCAHAGGVFTGARTRATQGIAQAIPAGKVTVVGHSLGSALGTYLTLELAAAPTLGNRVTACMFASPHPGDTAFGDYFDQNVATYTLYNYARDVVPTVPLFFGYASLPQAIKFTPRDAQANIRYDPLLPLALPNLMCQHHAVCYATMLDYHAADWGNLPPTDQGSVACIVGPATA